jgi:hypothetical protein
MSLLPEVCNIISRYVSGVWDARIDCVIHHIEGFPEVDTLGDIMLSVDSEGATIWSDRIRPIRLLLSLRQYMLTDAGYPLPLKFWTIALPLRLRKILGCTRNDGHCIQYNCLVCHVCQRLGSEILSYKSLAVPASSPIFFISDVFPEQFTFQHGGHITSQPTFVMKPVACASEGD